MRVGLQELADVVQQVTEVGGEFAQPGAVLVEQLDRNVFQGGMQHSHVALEVVQLGGRDPGSLALGVIQAATHRLELAAFHRSHQCAEGGNGILPGDVLVDGATLDVSHLLRFVVDVLEDVQHVAHVAVGVLGLHAQLGHGLGKTETSEHRAH